MIARLLRSANASTFLRAGAITALIRVSGLFCVFLLQVLLARLLGSASAYGVYAWGQALLFMLGGLAGLGMPHAAARFVAVHAGRGDATSTKRVLRKAQSITALSGTVFLAAACLLFLANAFDMTLGLSATITALACLGAPLVAWMNLNEAIGRARGWLTLAFLPSHVLRPLFAAIAVLGAAWLSEGRLSPELCLMLMAASIAAATVLQQLWAAVIHPLTSHEDRADDGEYTAQRLFRAGLPLFYAKAADLVMNYSTTLVVGLVSGPAEAGMFYAANRLSQLVLLPEQVAASVAQPGLARAHAAGDRETLERLSSSALHLAFWPTALSACVLMLVGPYALGIFGRDFAGAVSMLLVLLCAHTGVVALGPAKHVLMMCGDQKALAHVTGLVALIHLLGLALFVPGSGALGAALVTGTSSVLIGGLAAWRVKQHLGVRTTLLRSSGH